MEVLDFHHNKFHKYYNIYVYVGGTGTAFKSHPLYSLHANALQILFYFDEVEACNPIGFKYFAYVCFISWQLTTRTQIPTVIYTSGCTS